MAVQALSQRFGLLVKDKHTSLPLKDVSVDAEIQGYVLGLKSTLKYVNDSSDPVEVMFRFPLEQSHAVVGLTAVIDGRRIKAQIRGKEEARAAYDDAIASGQSAALAEEKSGDVFSISLGNLPPEKEAEIHLQLVGELPIDAEGSVRFSLPSTLKPRYTPAGSTDPLASVESGGAQAQVEHAQVSSVGGFRLSVLNAKGVAEITSPTHSIATAQDPTNDKVVVTLSDSKAVDKDLVVLIKLKDAHSPKACVEVGAAAKSPEGDFMTSSVVMVNFFPDIGQIETPSEFIFLVDRSGSMRGAFIKSARETLTLFLKSLPEESHFNIIGFGSRFEKLFDKSVAYSQKTLDKATQHAQTVEADLGGTELLSPLEHIFREKPSADLPRQVFVLTDGAVSNTEACIRKVKDNAGSSRCFTFGIGSGASTALVEGLARAGNGTAEFVKEGERLQPKVIRSLKRALQPAVTEVNLEFKVPSEFTATQSPHNLPPIFSGEKLVVYGILKPKSTPKSKVASGTAVLKAKLQGRLIKHSVPFTFNPKSEETPTLPMIHHLAAKALIKDWQNENKSKEDIVKLSVESSVISFHTAFIAVDEENSEPISGAMKTWVVQARYSGMSLFGGGGRGGGMPRSRGMRAAPMMLMSMSASPPRGGGGMMKKRKGKNAAPSKKSAPRSSSRPVAEFSCLSAAAPQHIRSVVFKRMKMEVNECMMDIDDDSDEEEPKNAQHRAAPKTTTHGPTTLSSFIDAQQANGSWKLDAQLAHHLGKPQKEIEDGCPTECKGDVATLWATILVFTLLRKRYASQQDEWELVGMKAESWVKKQTIPAGVTLQDFYTAAEKIVV